MADSLITSLKAPLVHISRRGVLTEKTTICGVRQVNKTKFVSKKEATSYARGLGYRTTKKMSIFLQQA